MKRLATKPCACEAKIDIRVSSVEELRRHGSELFAAHFDEVALHKGSTKLDPAWPQYYALEDRGLLFAFAAWHKERLVGYSATIVVVEHLHYQSLRCAQNDVLFVHYDYRAGSTGGRLMKLTKEEAKRRGCTRMLWHCKPGTALHRILDSREGLVVQDINYSEVLS